MTDIIKTETNIAFLTYYPLGNEVNLNETTNWLLEMGKAVYYPLSHKGGIMDFYQIHSLDELSEGRFHVMEPKEAEDLLFVPENNIETKAVVLTPGVVFDKNCNRKGHGMGYYDRYFERLSRIMSTQISEEIASNLTQDRDGMAIKIGIAYDFQIVDSLETKPWDVKMDIIVSDGDVHFIRRE